MNQTFWQSLPRPIIGLAPMDGVGDQPFRYLQKKYGQPALIFTEFTSVEALCYGDRFSMLNLLYDESQRPIIAQIYGKRAEYFRQVAVLLCELGFDGIDLNMGCPAATVASKGCGAGLIRTPDLAQSLIRAVQQGVQDWQNGMNAADCPDIPARFAAEAARIHQQLPERYRERHAVPVSVKTRIGYEEPTVAEWIPRLLETEPAAISLHGRTLRQAYGGQANWDEISHAAALIRQTDTLILGNGDVHSWQDAHQRAATYDVDGVLIGRASFGNPFVFAPSPAPAGEAKWARRQQLIALAIEHAHLYEQTFGQLPSYRFLPMRKHLGWYVKDIFGARQLRAKLVQTNSASEAEQLLREQGILATQDLEPRRAVPA